MSVARQFKALDETNRSKSIRGYAVTGSRAGFEFSLVCPTLEDCAKVWDIFMGGFELDETKIQEVVLSKPKKP